MVSDTQKTNERVMKNYVISIGRELGSGGKEIAEKLDMKLGTVKTRIFRVRNMMCRLITEGEEQTKS